MRGTPWSLVLLLFALPALARADEPKPAAAPTPAEQYQAILKEHDEAQKAFRQLHEAAKTSEEKNRLFTEHVPAIPERFAPQLLRLAEANPKDPAGFEAAAWVATRTMRSLGPEGPKAKAMALLVRDHLQSEQLGVLLPRLYKGGATVETFLRTVLEKSPHVDVQTGACLALVHHLEDRARTARHLKERPDSKGDPMSGAEYLATCRADDPAALLAEAERLAGRLADELVPKASLARAVSVAQWGGMGHDDKVRETLLRRLLEKDARGEVQAHACLNLAHMLKEQKRFSHSTDAQELAQVQQEAERLFERAAAKYADVPSGKRTVGEAATKALEELRAADFLQPGKPAPEIEALDQDGVKFKLSDYRGKVVLLDFGSEF